MFFSVEQDLYGFQLISLCNTKVFDDLLFTLQWLTDWEHSYRTTEFANIPCCKKCFSQRFFCYQSTASLPFTLFQDLTKFYNMNIFSRSDLIFVDWHRFCVCHDVCMFLCTACTYVSALMCSPVQKIGCAECHHFKSSINWSFMLSSKHQGYNRHTRHQE